METSLILLGVGVLIGLFLIAVFTTMRKISNDVRLLFDSNNHIFDKVNDIARGQAFLLNKFNELEKETKINQEKSLEVQKLSLEILNRLEKLETKFSNIILDSSQSALQRAVELNSKIQNPKFEYATVSGDNKFHEPVNSDNYNDVQLAFGTATVRQFPNYNILDISDIVYGTAYGSYKILVPQGDAITIPFSNGDSGSPAYEGNIAIDIKGEIKTFKVYYHAACFNLIRSIEAIQGTDTKSFRFVPCDGSKERYYENEEILEPEIEEVIHECEISLHSKFMELKERTIETGDLLVFIGDLGDTVFIKKGTKERSLIKDSANSYPLFEKINISEAFRESKSITFENTTAYIENDDVVINWNNNKRSLFNDENISNVMTFSDN